MIYVIDHKDSFTQNVIHQMSLYDKTECDDYNEVDKTKLQKASVIVFFAWTRKSQRLPKNFKYI